MTSIYMALLVLSSLVVLVIIVFGISRWFSPKHDGRTTRRDE